jgi:DNA (cytosine-5)-methyltransferase 1
MLTFGSLFAGIGGLDLGLERAGMRCAWQVEIDDYAQKVLSKHWPNVPRFGDIRECDRFNLASVDVIAGGFPCQDVSEAGKGEGITGTRSGLWGEFARLIGELRPRYALVENVSALLGRGMGRVLGDLAAIGYDTEWSVVSACALGAPHTRERVFIVAYPQRERWIDTGQNFNRVIHESLHAWSFNVYRRGHISGRIWPFPSAGHERVADGLPTRMDRLRGLGNAVVPQVAEYVGRAILDHAAAYPLAPAETAD